MSDLTDYKAVLDAAKALVAAEKAVADKGEKFRSMGFADYSVKARAAASDRLTDACHSRDKALDHMHKALVDANLCKPKERDAYDTRILTHSCGFGHSISFKYTPPLPRCYQP